MGQARARGYIFSKGRDSDKGIEDFCSFVAFSPSAYCIINATHGSRESPHNQYSPCRGHSNAKARANRDVCIHPVMPTVPLPPVHPNIEQGEGRGDPTQNACHDVKHRFTIYGKKKLQQHRGRP